SDPRTNVARCQQRQISIASRTHGRGDIVHIAVISDGRKIANDDPVLRARLMQDRLKYRSRGSTRAVDRERSKNDGWQPPRGSKRLDHPLRPYLRCRVWRSRLLPMILRDWGRLRTTINLGR